MKTAIIGDVHGCAEELTALLERLSLGDGDKVVLLGDLFDRGPDSWGVLQTVQALADKKGERFALLLGNHEDYLLQPRLTLSQRMIWDRVGRPATVRSFREHGGRMEDAIPWLAERCRLFYRGEGFQCVHAGLLLDPIELNDRNTLVHDHDVVFRNRYAGPLTVTGHVALEEPTYFHGDGQTYEKLPYGVTLPLPERGVICIDTGCGKGGRLTAMVVEGAAYTLLS